MTDIDLPMDTQRFTIALATDGDVTPKEIAECLEALGYHGVRGGSVEAAMIGIVVGPDSWTETTHPERRRHIIHAPAGLWLGPACNFGHDPADKLITGTEVQADAVTCWRCRHPQESAAIGPNGERRVAA